MWGTGLDPMFGVGDQYGDLVLSYEHYSFSGVGAGAGVGVANAALLPVVLPSSPESGTGCCC